MNTGHEKRVSDSVDAITILLILAACAVVVAVGREILPWVFARLEAFIGLFW